MRGGGLTLQQQKARREVRERRARGARRERRAAPRFVYVSLGSYVFVVVLCLCLFLYILCVFLYICGAHLLLFSSLPLNPLSLSLPLSHTECKFACACTLHPKPRTLNTKAETLNPKLQPIRLNPKP